MDLLLSSHNDDETLFASFTIQAHKPHVVICLKSQVQEDRYGILAETRERETGRALWWLGCPSWQQLLIRDDDPRAWERLQEDLEALDRRHAPERVWAPAIEEGGHDQHNLVGEVSLAVFEDRVSPYLTYVRGSLSSRGREVEFKPAWLATKLRAMSCYDSQIELENTRPWFLDNTLREYVPE